ncbi:helix-turn-helix domain-containing protein [Streptomyces sp. NPDC018019]|uniref:helix-turn-helix domain-containing protein n=1 Tax=Streptomyces sp. NPDC018019 TaxID=3365030 RepID=UPI0037BABB32
MAGDRPERGTSVSTVLGRRLGGELLRMRESRGMRQAQAAEALTASVPKVAKMERGLVPMRDPDVRALCHLYETDDADTVARLLGLAKLDRERRKAKGWWNEYPALRDMVEYVALEDAASGVRTWQQATVPGLLQTADYARALAVGNGAWSDLTEIESFVDARMARQARLDGESPLHLWATVHEAALRQLVGGRHVMRAQLGWLLERVEQPNITFQVLPYSAGAHPGVTNAFTMVSFEGPGAVDVVHMDTTSATVWLESEPDAVHHRAIFNRITRLGLAQRSSTELIASIRKEM